MRKLIFSMNISLDGYADHTVAIADDELHESASALLDNVDIILFGRVTYQLMASYWPHARDDPSATKSMVEFADRINAKSKIVFSRTLQKTEWNNTRLVKANIVEEVIKLKQQPGQNLSLGGISMCQEFLRLGLVDECWLLVQPVLIGKGKRLFEGLENRISLTLLDTKTFNSGVVVVHYRVDK